MTSTKTTKLEELIVGIKFDKANRCAIMLGKILYRARSPITMVYDPNRLMVWIDKYDVITSVGDYG